MSSHVFAKDMLAQSSPLIGLPIQQAVEQFVEGRRGHLAPQTIIDYLAYAKTIGATFKAICEKRGVDYRKLKIDHMDGHWFRAYQNERGTIDTCNKELCVVRQAYYQAFERKIADYQRLIKPKDYEEPGRPLRPDEREEWKKLCIEHADDPATDMCALSSLMSVCSAVGPGEIRNLKLKNCHIGETNALDLPVKPFVIISRRGAKRKSRERKVMLAGMAPWALQKLIDRAKKKGSTSPDHFLLPHQNRDHTYDPSRPAGRSFYTNGMRQLLALAETKFRFYDQRHDATSILLEDKRVPLAAAIAHCGWISPKMINRYYHASDDALTTVAKAINHIPDDEEEPAPKKLPGKVRALKLMKSCPECLGEIPEGARRCRHCGEPIRTKAAGAGAD